MSLLEEDPHGFVRRSGLQSCGALPVDTIVAFNILQVPVVGGGISLRSVVYLFHRPSYQ
jgi:hypothetical protein